MKDVPLKLSDTEVQSWAISHPKTTPAKLAAAYGIDYELLQNILDSWMDSTDSTVVNLASEIVVQNHIKAKRNNKDTDILVLCKAIEKLKNNLFRADAPMVSLRANRILGNVIDEFAQRKVTFSLQITPKVVDAIVEAARMDGESIIDVEVNNADDSAETSGNAGERPERPLLPCYSNPGFQENDCQSSQEDC